MTIANRCRVCLCGDRRMYAISNTVFQEIWERLTKFKFRTNDGKPLIVCYICCAHLRKSQKLMKRALKAEELLTALIENVPEESQNKILLLASKTHDLAYKYLVKELYELECNPLETNTVGGIKQEAEGGREEVNEEVNYIDIKEEEEVSDSHHEDDPDITDVESDTSLDVDTLLKEMLEKECRIVLEKIDMGAPAIEHKLVKEPERARPEQIELDETIEELNLLANTDLNSQPDNGKVLDISFFKKIPLDSNRDVSDDKQIKSAVNLNKILPKVNYIPKHIKIQAKNMIIQHNKTIASKVYNSENEALKQYRPKSVVVVAPITTLDRSDFENRESVNHLSSHTFQYPSVIQTDIDSEFSGDEPYTCHFCNYTCATMTLLNNHIKYKHIKGNRFSCNTCYKYVKKRDLFEHNLKHTREKSYQCYLCDYTCSQKSSLSLHLKFKHTKEKKFSCDRCDYKCVLRSTLNHHILKHTGEKPYQCDLCDYTSTQKGHLSIHLKFKHTKEKSFSCDRCDYKCVLRSTLNRHILKHTGEKPYQCDYCAFKCSVRGNLVNHTRSKHTKEKKFKCDICEYRCLTKEKLTVHTRKHTGEKPYHCDLCEVRCARRSHLIRHIQYIHTKERNFSCDTCPSKFVTISALKRHLHTHNKEKPYICDICDYSCIDKYNLRLHITSKHLKKEKRGNQMKMAQS